MKPGSLLLQVGSIGNPGAKTETRTSVDVRASRRRTNVAVSGRLAFHHRSFGDVPVFHVVPECNEQFAGQRDTPNPSQPTTATSELALIPRGQGAGWLIPDPAPGELHHDAAHVLIAGAGDGLIVRALAHMI